MHKLIYGALSHTPTEKACTNVKQWKTANAALFFFSCERGRRKVPSATITANFSLETGGNFLRINVSFGLDNMVIQRLMTVSVFVVRGAETPLMIFPGRKWRSCTGSVLFRVCRSIRTCLMA